MYVVDIYYWGILYSCACCKIGTTILTKLLGRPLFISRILVPEVDIWNDGVSCDLWNSGAQNSHCGVLLLAAVTGAEELVLGKADKGRSTAV